MHAKAWRHWSIREPTAADTAQYEIDRVYQAFFIPLFTSHVGLLNVCARCGAGQAQLAAINSGWGWSSVKYVHDPLSARVCVSGFQSMHHMQMSV